MRWQKRKIHRAASSGVLYRWLILALLDQEDMYGYQIVQEITERSGGAIVTEEGSLYPVLYKLQDQGMLSGEKVLVGKRMTRVYYHLEEPAAAVCRS